MRLHIKLYVNDYTVSLGEKGRAAVEKFLSLQDAERQKVEERTQG